MKIRIIPVAAGPAAAAGLALTGASLATADPTPAVASTAPNHGQAPGGQTLGGVPGQGNNQEPWDSHGNTDPRRPRRDDEELLTGDVAAKVAAAARAKEPGAAVERLETDSDGI